MQASLQVRGLGPATLPRWGSRVRIPSSAPGEVASDQRNAVGLEHASLLLRTEQPTKDQRNVCRLGVHGAGVEHLECRIQGRKLRQDSGSGAHELPACHA